MRKLKSTPLQFNTLKCMSCKQHKAINLQPIVAHGLVYKLCLCGTCMALTADSLMRTQKDK